MFLSTLKNLRDVMLAERTPEQVARGIALGIAVGLIPKANLICLFLALLMFVTRANLAAGFVTALLCAWISPLLDPLTSGIGRTVLEFGPVQPLWAVMYRLPVVPWTMFNNTVVMGNLIVALAIMPPVYLVLRKRLTIETPKSTPSVVPAPKLKKRQKFVVGQPV